jgi:pimeloyl-ACP methyl ester carboxylesterase
MARAQANGIELEYDAFGDEKKPVVLLVNGFSLQMIWWEEDFCRELATRGFRVVRFDNRDVGLSSKITGKPAPSVPAILMGDRSSVAYALDDMARDAVGLLDALGVEKAHVVGRSMGGMIAQLVAIQHPTRVASLCSIMSTTGSPAVGQAAPHILPIIMAPTPSDRAGFLDRSVEVWRALSSPAHPLDVERVRSLAGRSFDRCFDPDGAARQIAAIITASDRTNGLEGVCVPTLVIHGRDDLLVAPSGAEATARAVPNAKLLLIAGMGHELAPRVWPEVIDAIVTNASRA